MAKRSKPPGFEKWTWEEIRLGGKMGKGEKRIRRIQRNFGATEGPDGRIQPPKGEEKLLYYFVMAALLIVCLVVAFAFPEGCHAKR